MSKRWKKVGWDELNYRYRGCIVKIDQEDGVKVEGRITYIEGGYGKSAVMVTLSSRMGTVNIGVREMDCVWVCKSGPQPNPAPDPAFFEAGKRAYWAMRGNSPDEAAMNRGWSQLIPEDKDRHARAAEAAYRHIRATKKARKELKVKWSEPPKDVSMRCR